MGIISWFTKLFKKEEVVLPKKKFKKHKKKLSSEEKRLKEELANQKLKEELAKAQNINKTKKKTTQESETEPNNTKEEIISNTKTQKPKETLQNPTLLETAKSLATDSNTVLYVSCTVKRLKVIEWRNNKTKTILNKEREIRHTHKGGWSQEKFQGFVERQKAATFEWIETNLSKNGVLRGPYDEILVDSKDEKLKKQVEKFLDKFKS